MSLIVTSLTAAVLTVLYLFLSFRIIDLRRRGIAPSLGTGDDQRVIQAVRAHANLTEYAPLFLILLLLAELQSAPLLITTVCAITFVVGRLCHAYGLSRNNSILLRTLGMVGTNTALIVLAGFLVVAQFN
jgi:uncharacterized protein